MKANKEKSFMDDAKEIFESTKESGQDTYLIATVNKDTISAAVKASDLDIAKMVSYIIVCSEKNKENREVIIELIKRGVQFYEKVFENKGV